MCELTPTTGVRQGCVASPLEWNVFMFAVFDRLRNQPVLGHEWILAHLLVFADDLLSHWSFTSVDDARKALVEIGMFLDLIESCGLKINAMRNFFSSPGIGDLPLDCRLHALIRI